MNTEHISEEATDQEVEVYKALLDAIVRIDAIGHRGYADLIRQYSEPIWLAMSEEQQDRVIADRAAAKISWKQLSVSESQYVVSGPIVTLHKREFTFEGVSKSSKHSNTRVPLAPSYTQLQGYARAV